MEIKSSKGKEIKIPGPDHHITISPVEGKVRVTVAGKDINENHRREHCENARVDTPDDSRDETPS